MAYKIKKNKEYRFGVYNKKGIPIQFDRFIIKAKNEREAKKLANKKIKNKKEFQTISIV